MCVFTYTHIHTYIHTYRNTYIYGINIYNIHIYAYIYGHIYMDIYIYIYTYILGYLQHYIHTHTHTHTQTHMDIYVYTARIPGALGRPACPVSIVRTSTEVLDLQMCTYIYIHTYVYSTYINTYTCIHIYMRRRQKVLDLRGRQRLWSGCVSCCM